jgi:hypothetical protein
MSDTLTAALVSGLLSGLVVLTGVVLAEALRRRSDVEQRQRRLVFDLVRELGHHERALRAQPPPTTLADQHAVVLSALFELRNVTRASTVRAAADESIARVQAALQRSLAGEALPVAASLGGQELVAAALPETPALTERITRYVREGLPVTRSSDEGSTASPDSVHD